MGAVLVQNPKGGGVDATFGGSASNQIFGAAKSTDFIEKLTWGLFALMLILCIVAALVAGGMEGSGGIILESGSQ